MVTELPSEKSFLYFGLDWGVGLTGIFLIRMLDLSFMLKVQPALTDHLQNHGQLVCLYRTDCIECTPELRLEQNQRKQKNILWLRTVCTGLSIGRHFGIVFCQRP